MTTAFLTGHSVALSLFAHTAHSSHLLLSRARLLTLLTPLWGIKLPEIHAVNAFNGIKRVFGLNFALPKCDTSVMTVLDPSNPIPAQHEIACHISTMDNQLTFSS